MNLKRGRGVLEDDESYSRKRKQQKQEKAKGSSFCQYNSFCMNKPEVTCVKCQKDVCSSSHSLPCSADGCNNYVCLKCTAYCKNCGTSHFCDKKHLNDKTGFCKTCTAVAEEQKKKLAELIKNRPDAPLTQASDYATKTIEPDSYLKLNLDCIKKKQETCPGCIVPNPDIKVSETNPACYAELLSLMIERAFEAAGQASSFEQTTYAVCIIGISPKSGQEKTNLGEYKEGANVFLLSAGEDGRSAYLPAKESIDGKLKPSEVQSIQDHLRTAHRPQVTKSFLGIKGNHSHAEMKALQKWKDLTDKFGKNYNVEILALSPSKGCCYECHIALRDLNVLRLVTKLKHRYNTYQAWHEEDRKSCVWRWVETDSKLRHHLMIYDCRTGNVTDLGSPNTKDGRLHNKEHLSQFSSPEGMKGTMQLQTLRTTRQEELTKLKKDYPRKTPKDKDENKDKDSKK